MTTHDVRIAQKIEVRAVITRCGCAASGHPWQECHVWLGPDNSAPCAHPLAVEDKGVVSYWHRHWWMRVLGRLRGYGTVRARFTPAEGTEQMAATITRKGRDIITFRLRGAPAAGTEPLNVGWGQGIAGVQATAASTDVAPFSELPEARVAGTSSQQTTTTGNDTYRVTATITATGTRTVNEVFLSDSTTKHPSTTVSSGAWIGSSSATTGTVAANAGFPGSGNYFIQVRTEVLQVTAGQGTNNWTFNRGANGSGAIATIAASDVVTGGNGGNDTAVANGNLFIHADHGNNALNNGDSIAYTINVQLT